MEREVRAMQLFRSERFIQLLDYGVGPIAEQLERWRARRAASSF